MSLAAMMVAAGLSGPALAQDADAPAPTPAPAPGRSIDFRLPPANDGRTPGVQGPSDNGLPPLAPGERRGLPTPTPTPAPSPTPAQPRAPVIVPTQPTPTPSATTPPPSADGPAVSRPAARSAPTTVPSAAPPPAEPTLPDTAAPPPLETVAPPEAESSLSVSDDEALVEQPAPTNDGGAAPWWAWMLAALAAVGAGLWYWRRRPALAGDAPVDEPAIAEKPAAPPQRAAAPPPAPSPEPTPAPVAPPPPRPASTLVTRPLAEQRAQVSLELEIRSIQILPDRVEIGFSLAVTNRGSLAATGLMIRIAAGQGSAMQEAVLARFFDGAGGSMLRDDMVIEPGASDSVSTEIALPRAAIEPLMIAGKPMLVPVMAFDITYHWDGPGDAFGQQAETFVLGRLGDATEKLAPLPLDRAKHKVERPAARATAMRRVQ